MDNHTGDFIASAALLYQKHENGQPLSKVLSVLIVKSKDDDIFDMKATAERYVSEALSDKVKGMCLVAWHFSVSDIPYLGNKGMSQS